MPDNVPSETPGQRVMRQHYQARTAARMMQVADMMQNRGLLRRGARLQQDGKLGEGGSTTPPEGDEPMHVSVGDVIQYYQTSGTVGEEEPENLPVAKALSEDKPLDKAKVLGAKALTALALGSALLGGGTGVAVPWLLGAFDKPQPAATAPVEDTDTVRRVEIQGGEPTLEW